MKGFNVQGKRFYIVIIIIIAIAYGCAPLQPNTTDDFRGTTFQRYEESPQEVLQAIETTILNQKSMQWTIDSTNIRDETLTIITNFSPVNMGTFRLSASVQENKGTLASFEVQGSDSSSVYMESMYEDFTKPIFDELKEEHLTVTSVDKHLEGKDPALKPKNNFFDRIGFFVNADGGFSTRQNFYSSNDSLRSDPGENVDYQSERLNFTDFHARTGLAGIQLAEFNYETKPQNNFQQEAYEFNEDRSYGIEKYTYGVDLLPLWMTILPADKPKFLNFITRLLSARFRSVKELTQTTAKVTTPSIAYPSFENVDSGDSYSFRTRYRFRSASIPLFLFMANQGHFNVGIAHWKFSRTYAMTELSEQGVQNIFDATVETVGPIIEFYYEIHESSLGRAVGRSGKTIPESLEGLRIDMFIGTGLEAGSSFRLEEGELAEMLDEEEVTPINHNVELSVSYPIKLLNMGNRFDVSLRVGGEANAFVTYFKNYHDYTKVDWIVNPWFRLSMEFN